MDKNENKTREKSGEWESMMKNTNRARKRQNRNRLGNQLALAGIIAVVLSLAVVINVSASSLREKDLEYQAREASLNKTLLKEQARSEQLEEYRVYVQTKQYVEKIAKEKLGLVKKDEILFKAEESR